MRQLGRLLPFWLLMLTWSGGLAVRWFDKKRGRVMGVMMVTRSIVCSGPYALAYETAVHTIGWRLTQQWAALSCLLMALPVTLFVFHRPEDVGCLPDGARPEDRHTDPEAAEARAEERRGLISGTDEDEDEEEAEEAPATPVAGSDFTLREALRTSALWLLMSRLRLPHGEHHPEQPR